MWQPKLLVKKASCFVYPNIVNWCQQHWSLNNLFLHNRPQYATESIAQYCTYIWSSSKLYLVKSLHTLKMLSRWFLWERKLMWSTQTVAFSLSLLLGSPGFFREKMWIINLWLPIHFVDGSPTQSHDTIPAIVDSEICLAPSLSKHTQHFFAYWSNVAVETLPLMDFILLEALTNLPSSFSSVAVKLVKESCVAGDPRTSSLMTRLYSPSQDRYICFNQKGKVRAMVSSHTIFLFTHNNLQLTNIFASQGASKVLFAAHTFTLLFLSGNHYHMQFWLLLSKAFTQLLPSICILT